MVDSEQTGHEGDERVERTKQSHPGRVIVGAVAVAIVAVAFVWGATKYYTANSAEPARTTDQKNPAAPGEASTLQTKPAQAVVAPADERGEWAVE